MRKFLKEGIAAPPEPKDDRISSANFMDPIDFLKKLYDSPDRDKRLLYQASLKDWANALQYGAIEGPVEGGFYNGVFEGKPLMSPVHFGVPQGEGKSFKIRFISHMSKQPFGPLPPRLKEWTFNSSYDGTQTGCSFPDLRDKAAMLAAHPGGWIFISDISGYYYHLEAHHSICNLQAKILWFEGIRDFLRELFEIWFPEIPEDQLDDFIDKYTDRDGALTFIVRGTIFGQSNAPAFSLLIHRCVVEAGNKQHDERPLTSDSFRSPDDCDLATDPRHFKKLLPTKKVNKTNAYPFAHTQGLVFAKWKTGCSVIDWFGIHIDDLFAINISKRESYLVRGFLRDLYRRVNFTVSPKTDPEPSRRCEVTGHLLDTVKGTIGFVKKKWIKWDKAIYKIEQAHSQKMTFEDILKAVGAANHASTLFPRCRVFLNPIARLTGRIGVLAKSDRRLWWKLKDVKVLIPALLLDMLFAGWELAKSLRTVHCYRILRNKFDYAHIFSSDAAGFSYKKTAALGAISHSTGLLFAIKVTRDFATFDVDIQIQEAIACLVMLRLVVEIYRLKGEMIVAYTDNTSWEFAVRDSFKNLL